MSTAAYAGIGSRSTPANILAIMAKCARVAAQNNLTLRSGGADGADTAFEHGCDSVGGSKEIYLPWRHFNGNHSMLYGPSAAAYLMAEKFHPNWGACKQGARALHARNCHQIMGSALNDPVNFVLCWTPNGSGSGGTGQAIRLAKSLDITVYDMGASSMLDFIVHELLEVSP